MQRPACSTRYFRCSTPASTDGAFRLKSSRSELHARALADFVVQHDDNHTTAAMNAVIDEVGPEVDEFTRRAARRALRHVEW